MSHLTDDQASEIAARLNADAPEWLLKLLKSPEVAQMIKETAPEEEPIFWDDSMTTNEYVSNTGLRGLA